MNNQLQELLSYCKYLLIQHTGITNIMTVITFSMIIIGGLCMLLSTIVVYDLRSTTRDRKQKSSIAVFLAFTGYFLVMLGFIYWI